MKEPGKKTNDPGEFRWTPLHLRLASEADDPRGWQPSEDVIFAGREKIHGLRSPVLLQPVPASPPGAVRLGFVGAEGTVFTLELLAMAIPSVADVILGYCLLNNVPPPGDGAAAVTWELQDTSAPIWGTVSGIAVQKKGDGRAALLLAPQAGAITEGLEVELDEGQLRALGGALLGLYNAMDERTREARLHRLHHIGAALQVDSSEESPTIGDLQRKARALAGVPRQELPVSPRAASFVPPAPPAAPTIIPDGDSAALQGSTMNPSAILALSVLLSGRSGIDMPREFKAPRQEPRPIGPADQERIAAAQAKRERKAARLTALARKS